MATCYRAVVPIHRTIRRPWALALSFIWLYAISLIAFVVVGPIMLGVISVLVDGGDSVAEALRDGIQVVGESYLGLVTFQWVDDVLDDDFWVVIAIFTGWVLLQVAFLSPLVGRPKIAEEGRRMLPSALTVILISTTATALLWVALVESLVAVFTPDQTTFDDVYDRIVMPWGWFVAIGVWTVGGFIWYRLLRSAGRSHDPTGLDRLLRRLLAGTAIEVALGTLAVLLVRRRHDCLCITGSFFSLAYSLTVLLWMCGPWAVLFATRAERSRWRLHACVDCGYLRRPGSARCPECGHVYEDDEAAADGETAPKPEA